MDFSTARAGESIEVGLIVTRAFRTVDCLLGGPAFAAAYVGVDGEECVTIDNGTARSVPRILSALAEHGRRPEEVRYVIVTHVHLDHAGGTSALLAHCPRARVVAHPRAARHLADPSRLEASARKVYGDAEFDRVYGSLRAISADRIVTVDDGGVLPWGRGELAFLHTRGHANHHFCVWDSSTGSIFTGDSFGLAYPALQTRGLFVYASTTPTDFDADEAIRSVDRIVATGASTAYLTHFGPIGRILEAADQLRESIRVHAKVLRDVTDIAGDRATLTVQARQRLAKNLTDRLTAGFGGPPPAWALDWIVPDLELNAAGLAHVALKAREAVTP